ncbi:MAG TPA: UDP-3-O-(3-hydroxymyristoyl)glucosamine N-acyltransferase [Pantanalinema sp.]
MAGLTLQELAERLGGTVDAQDASFRIAGVANPEEATPRDLVFLVEDKYLASIAACAAGAVVARSPVAGKATVVVKAPREAMARTLALFAPPQPLPHRSEFASVDPSAEIAEGVSVGPHVTVGPRARVGRMTVLHPGVVIGPDARVGEACVLYPNVVVREGCTLGDRVIVQPGAVIGSDGFGFVTMPDRTHLKMPQIGVVEVQDDVEIGANVTIDRATIGATVIGQGTKIDNLVHVGHNVRIGENGLLVSQVGISGSVTVGDRVTIAGQAGVAGHLTIGADTVVAAKAGVTKSLPPRVMVSGFPARPHREELRRQAQIERLGELAEQVKALQAAIAAVQGTCQGT